MAEHLIRWQYQGYDYIFHTTSTLFSYRRIDTGTLLMIQKTTLLPEDKVLDLGCGYGVVGIWAAHTLGADHVVMCDINTEAISQTSANLRANHADVLSLVCCSGFEQIPDRDFTRILSNPPYHTNFSVAKSFIEGSYHHLLPGGTLTMVTKRFLWYKNKLEAVFGGVRWECSNGYYLFTAEKRTSHARKTQKKTMSRKLQRKYR